MRQVIAGFIISFGLVYLATDAILTHRENRALRSQVESSAGGCAQLKNENGKLREGDIELKKAVMDLIAADDGLKAADTKLKETNTRLSQSNDRLTATVVKLVTACGDRCR